MTRTSLRHPLPAVLAALALAACGGGGGGASPQVSAPVITAHPASRAVTVGETASFTVTASGTGLSFRWQRGTSDIAGATGATYVTPAATLDDQGATFRVVVTNAAGSVTSQAATLTVAPLVAPVRAEPWVAGTAHGGVALKADGTVWAWGDGGVGQLGQGTTASTTAPVQVRDASGAGVLDRVLRISAGPEHVLALRDDGTVWAWGRSPALGASDTGDQTALLPVQVKGVGGAGVLERVVDVSAGDRVDAAVLDDGTVVAWGDNRRGGVGIGTETGGVFAPADVYFPAVVPGVAGVVQVSAGYHRVLARRSDGSILSWGANEHGELGRATPDTATAGQVAGIASAVRVVAGYSHSLAILSDGTARVWGLHPYDGTPGTSAAGTCEAVASATPAAIPLPAGASSFSMAAATAAGSAFVHGGHLLQSGPILADLAAARCTRGLEQEPGASRLVGAARTWGWHTHTWDADGRVRGYGENGAGELGVGDTVTGSGARELPGFNLYGAPGAATQVLAVDFESPPPLSIGFGPGAERTPVQDFAGLGPEAAPFQGQLLRSATGNVVSVQVEELPPHRTISLAFLFAAIDSLDGAGSFPAGDYFTIELDGETIFREAFANADPGQVQTYLPPPGVELARRVDLGFSGPGGYYTDSAYDLGAEPRLQGLPHTSATARFTLRIEGAGIQDLGDESWGMDNLRVSIAP
ncbi:MAG: hypothetical protein QM767_28340 [Anaeromyxobacter sp.]